jgi:uncharacterized protein (TIGR03067 family)
MSEIVILVFLIAPTDDAAVRKEAKSLEGNWMVVAWEVKGEKLPKEKFQFQGLVFAAADASDKQKPDGSFFYTAQLDPSKSPKAIQTAKAVGNRMKPRFVGVYELDGDTLKLCLGEAGAAPTELTTDPEGKSVLLELKRAKTLPKARDPKALAEEGERDKARMDVRVLTVAAETYKIKNEEYPAKLEDLIKPPDGETPYIEPKEGVLKDPWGQPYKYDPKGPKSGGKQPDIWSEGPPGKKQPIGNWEALKERGKKE